MKIYTSKSNCYPAPIAARIIREYFKVVGSTILTGQEFKFPRRFGVIYVTKRKAKKNDKITEHTKQVGWDYDIIMKSPYLDRFDYEYKPAPTLRKALFRKLQKGKEYIQYAD